MLVVRVRTIRLSNGSGIVSTLNGGERESREFTWLNLSECLKSFVPD